MATGSRSRSTCPTRDDVRSVRHDRPATIDRSERIASDGDRAREAFVGAVGSDDRLDFTALGDTVNVAARLGSDAGAGELLVSDAAWRAAGRTDAAERRELIVKGRNEPLGVVVLRGETSFVVA